MAFPPSPNRLRSRGVRCWRQYRCLPRIPSRRIAGSARARCAAALFALIVGLSSVVGACLWRTWWALLGVPAALWLGAVAADALYRAPDRLLSGAEVVMALDLLVVAALPAAVGAAIGAAAGMRLERRPSQ